MQEAIDTTTNGGKLSFHVLGALAEVERGITRERTLAGLDVEKKRHAVTLQGEATNSARDIGRTLEIPMASRFLCLPGRVHRVRTLVQLNRTGAYGPPSSPRRLRPRIAPLRNRTILPVRFEQDRRRAATRGSGGTTCRGRPADEPR